jgi:hypothetical protein
MVGWHLGGVGLSIFWVEDVHRSIDESNSASSFDIEVSDTKSLNVTR